MGIRSRNPKKPWVPGKDMPFFSGATWGEIEDIYPKEKRIASDIWRVIGLMAPAWVLSRAYCNELVGAPIHFRDFQMLCFLNRVEETKASLALDPYPLLKAFNIGGTLFYKRKVDLHRLGLIEKMPLPRVRLYRITPKGKLLIKHFHDNLEKANDNLLYWVYAQPKEHQDKITRILRKYYLGWEIISPPISKPPE